MIHGKVKEKFEEWYNTSPEVYLLSGIDFDDLPLVCQQALVVEWLDTFEEIGDKDFLRIFLEELSISYRISQATAKAIEKCINLLNERL